MRNGTWSLWRMRALAILVMATVTLIAGCAAVMSPGAKLRNEVFWEAATQCESDTLLIVGSNMPYAEFLPAEGKARGVQIDIDGRITMHADAESHGELEAFTKCYRQAVSDRVDRRRRAGLSIPDELTVAPTVELD